MTERIRSLTEHFKVHKNDHHSRRGLLKLVGQRRRLLDYLKNKNTEQYKMLIKELELKKLQAESDQLIARLKNIDREQLVEELQCFRDTLGLQRRLIESANGSGDSPNGGA